MIEVFSRISKTRLNSLPPKAANIQPCTSKAHTYEMAVGLYRRGFFNDFLEQPAMI